MERPGLLVVKVEVGGLGKRCDVVSDGRVNLTYRNIELEVGSIQCF